ncbi:hypothetical protein TYRP_004903 [Tyrophagus putrescentiae]|nr:hypothetical protein TYRP_004903 [Tyrophagus putrescentiae]
MHSSSSGGERSTLGVFPKHPRPLIILTYVLRWKAFRRLSLPAESSSALVGQQFSPSPSSSSLSTAISCTVKLCMGVERRRRSVSRRGIFRVLGLVVMLVMSVEPVEDSCGRCSFALGPSVAAPS